MFVVSCCNTQEFCCKTLLCDTALRKLSNVMSLLFLKDVVIRVKSTQCNRLPTNIFTLFDILCPRVGVIPLYIGCLTMKSCNAV